MKNIKVLTKNRINKIQVSKVLTPNKLIYCFQILAFGFFIVSCGKNQKQIEDINFLETISSQKIETHSDFNDLSKYWAQEYAGSDLTREEIITSYNASKLMNVVIWDSNHENHDLKVSNLISSPLAPSSPLINYPRLQVIQTEDQETIIKNLKTTNLYCKENPEECPAYINNSEHWNIYGIDKLNPRLSDELEQFSKHSTLVTISGNYHGPMELLKENAAQKNQIVTVGSVNEFGNASIFNNYSENITISAPSDDKLYSFDNKSEVVFGGTSGAAPQVTSALLIFSLYTGVKLPPASSIKLLQKSSLPFPNYPSNTNIGKGILNTYKIFKIAKKLNELCSSEVESNFRERCILEKLEETNVYSFEINKENFIKKYAEIERTLHESSVTKIDPLTKLKLILFLKDFRRMALLDNKSPEIWNAISKIYSFLGLQKNSVFYASLSKRVLLADEAIIEKNKTSLKTEDFFKIILLNSINFNKQVFNSSLNLKNNTQVSLILDALKKPFMKGSSDLIIKLVEQGDNELNSYLDGYILNNENWQTAFKINYGISGITSRKIKWFILKKI